MSYYCVWRRCLQLSWRNDETNGNDETDLFSLKIDYRLFLPHLHGLPRISVHSRRASRYHCITPAYQKGKESSRSSNYRTLHDLVTSTDTLPEGYLFDLLAQGSFFKLLYGCGVFTCINMCLRFRGLVLRQTCYPSRMRVPTCEFKTKHSIACWSTTCFCLDSRHICNSRCSPLFCPCSATWYPLCQEGYTAWAG
jgi:hypothetical protein